MSTKEKETPPIGIIGLGIIGSRCAENLRTAGHDVYVWSPTPRPIPNFLGSAAEVASVTKTIQLFVRDSEALLEVLATLSPQLTHEHTIINCATVSPEATAQAAQTVSSSGAAFLDCPFTGSKVAAENAALVYYVGGNKETLEQVRPLLETTAKEILHLGEIGHATALKLATNMISAATVAALGEALAVTHAAGVSPEKLGRAIASNACASGVTGLKLPSLLAGDFSPHFSTKNMLKDARYAAALPPSEKSTPLPVHQEVIRLLEKAAANGDADNDFSALAKHHAQKAQ